MTCYFADVRSPSLQLPEILKPGLLVACIVEILPICNVLTGPGSIVCDSFTC